MKCMLTTLLLAISALLGAQAETEIYLFDLILETDTPTLSNQRNISNNEGYDSQPFFLTNDILIYAGTRDGNTEIIQYADGTSTQFNHPTLGGEYSPQFMPGKRGVSAVRLDPDGLQRLYSYLPRAEQTPVIVEDAVVAYYTWANATTIVGADIVDEDLHLVIHDLETSESHDLEIIVGRSFHKIPDTDLISFVDKSSTRWVVQSINPKTQEIKKITSLPEAIEDITWLPNGAIIGTKGQTLYINRDRKQWEVLYTFKTEGVKNLSRVAVSPDGAQLALVAEK